MDNLNEAMSNYVAEDKKATLENICLEFGLSNGTAANNLKDDLGLSTKAARWVLKELMELNQQERIRCSSKFVREAFKDGKAYLNSIVTMDKTNVLFHIPESKEVIKKCMPKGSRGPAKFKTQDSRKKQMVISFINNKALIYQNYVSLGTTVNVAYFVNALRTFLKHFKARRPSMSLGE